MQLIDSFNRVHDYLRISITDKCNLRCYYCMPDDLPRGYFSNAVWMSPEEINSIASTFIKLGVKKIRITGGEPLVRKEAGRIIELLSRHSLELAITTNGIYVDEFIENFRQAGIKSVNISLDTLKPDRYFSITRRNYFSKVLSNIYLLLKNDFRVKVNTVLTKSVNDEEIIDFVEWTKEFPLHVRFIEFMPFEGNKWDWNNGISFEELLKKIKTNYGEKILRLNDAKNDTARNFSVNGYKGTFAIISSVTNPFCDTCNRLRLTADGKMKNCLFSNTETDLLTPLRNGEDIVPLILQSVQGKKEVRAGITTLDEFAKQKNRAMVAIGG